MATKTKAQLEAELEQMRVQLDSIAKMLQSQQNIQTTQTVPQ